MSIIGSIEELESELLNVVDLLSMKDEADLTLVEHIVSEIVDRYVR